MVCEVHLYLHYLCPTKRWNILKYTLYLLNKWRLSKPCMKQRRPSPTQTLYWFCQKPIAEWIQPLKEINNNSHHMIVYCIAPRCTFVQWTYSIIKMELFRVHPNFQLWNGLTNVALEWYSFSSNYSRSINSLCYCDSTLKFSTADSIYILQGILSDTWDSEKTQP